MENIRIKAQITNLDKPTRNGRLYTKEALEGAFDNPAFLELNNHRAVPIVDSAGDIVGVAQCKLDYPTINIEGVVTRDLYDYLTETSLTHSGVGHIEYDAEHDVQIVKDYKLCELLLSSRPACVSCLMEVVEEDS